MTLPLVNQQPTSRELEVLQLYADHHRVHGECPTATWIAEQIGISRESVRQALVRIVNKGGMNEHYVITKEGRNWLK